MLSRVRLRGINAHNALHPASYIASWYQFMLLGEQGHTVCHPRILFPKPIPISPCQSTVHTTSLAKPGIPGAIKSG